jgi:hypothetical protein
LINFFLAAPTKLRLCINKGNPEFEDVTGKAGLITNPLVWGTMVDINQTLS